MKVSKKNTLIVSIAAIVIVVAVACLYYHPITALKKLDSKQVSSVVYVGEEEKICYYYPENAAKELIDVLKNAKLKGFPTNESGKYKGGGPMMPIAIIFEDNSRIKVSYMTANDKIYLIINGKWYTCDEKTVEKFKSIDRECYSKFKEVKGLN